MRTLFALRLAAAVIGGMGFIALQLVHAQSNANPQPKAPVGFLADFTWMTEPWTDDDKPFIEIDRGIARLQKRGVNLKSKLVTYRLEAIQNMAQPKKPYRWASASCQVVKPLDYAVGAIRSDSPLLQDGVFEVLMRPAVPNESYYFDDPNFKRLYAIKQAGSGPMKLPVRLPPPVRSYRYSRMLFIAGVTRGRIPGSEALFRQLGERLLRRNSHDAQVKALCVGLWRTDVRAGGKVIVKTDNVKAIRYARELVQENPTQPDYLLLLAYAQLGRDYAGMNATLQRYLKVTPLNAPHRHIALYQLNLLAQYQRAEVEMKRKS